MRHPPAHLGPGTEALLSMPLRARLAHVNLEVSQLERAVRFYQVLLGELGFRILPRTDPVWVGFRQGPTTIWLTESHPPRVARGPPRVPTSGAVDPISDHLGFRASSGKEVLAIERRLRRRGLRPVYATCRVPTAGSTWYVSNAWQDPDRNVMEVYASVPRRPRQRRR